MDPSIFPPDPLQAPLHDPPPLRLLPLVGPLGRRHFLKLATQPARLPLDHAPLAAHRQSVHAETLVLLIQRDGKNQGRAPLALGERGQERGQAGVERVGGGGMKGYGETIVAGEEGDEGDGVEVEVEGGG